MTKDDISASRWSPEEDLFIQLERMKYPGKNATREELYNYWVDMRDLAGIAMNAAVKAGIVYGEAKGKEQKETEHGRMDYIDKRCHNCKHFHFGNLNNSWCDYHNEAVCTIGKPCLCWKLRKEQE
jgi:hypothetical protein